MGGQKNSKPTDAKVDANPTQSDITISSDCLFERKMNDNFGNNINKLQNFE